MSNDITTIQFHGASLVVQLGDGPENTLVAMKPLVEGMKLDWAGQFTKLKSHPVLSKGVEEISIPSAGGAQMMTALPLNRLHFWMATLHPNKIKDTSIRERVVIFQTEAADALFDRFFGSAIHSPVTNNEIGRRVAAIVEDKLNKALMKLLPGMIKNGLEADERAVAVDFKPALLILQEKKVPSRRRRAFSQKVSSRLRRFSTDHGYPMKISRESGRYLFHIDAINAWLVKEGGALIRDHIAIVSGQGSLRLVTA